MINYMSNKKVMMIHLIAGLIKKIMLCKMSYSSSYSHSKSKIDAKLYLSNYAIKYNLKNATGVDAWQDDLANLRTEVDKLEIDKLEKVLSGLNGLKNKVDN